MSDWRELKLEEVFAVDNRRLGVVDVEPPVLSVTKYDGLVRADKYFGKRIASERLDDYKVVDQGSWAFSTIHIDEGSIARSMLSSSGVVSPMYTTMTWIGVKDDPAYYELLLKSPEMLRRYRDSAQGSVNRRRSLPFKAFADLTVLVPPLREQRRIVDLIGVLDTNVAREQETSARAQGVLFGLLANHTQAISGGAVRIADCCSEVIGGVWGQPPGESDVDAAALGPRIYTPGTPGFVVDGSPVRSFTVRQAASRMIRNGDIILERSGGSPDQPVGRVVIAGGSEGECVPTDFQRLLRPNTDVVIPRYLFWRLWHNWRAGVTTSYSRRTTGITNLAVQAYLDRSISLPSRGEQGRVVDLADAISEFVDASNYASRSLVWFRQCLLQALLSGEIRLPASYDVLLPAAI